MDQAQNNNPAPLHQTANPQIRPRAGIENDTVLVGAGLYNISYFNDKFV
jgi:hypothetical protein